MGYETTINYIVKSDQDGLMNLVQGQKFMISKSGSRHFLMNLPLYLADGDWNIIGKCMVIEQTIQDDKTFLNCVLLFLFNEEDREVITRLNKLGELEKNKEQLRKNPECPIAKKWATRLTGRSFNFANGIFNNKEEMEEAQADNIIIVYEHDGMMLTYFRNTDWSVYDKISHIDGNFKTNIRHIPFKLEKTNGLIISKFDLVGFSD